MNNVLDRPNYTDALTVEYDLRKSLLRFPATTIQLLESISEEQLNLVKFLEELDEKSAEKEAKKILNNTVWPKGLSGREMDYDRFKQDLARGVAGDVAFYYYIIDKSIPRRGRNLTAPFMLRLATFAKASFRELWEETRTWTFKGTKITFKLEPNKLSSKKNALLPQSGEFAPDHQIAGYIDLVEEKPWPLEDPQGAFDKWGNAKACYDAKYLMVFCEPSKCFYLYDWQADHIWEIIPDAEFPGYPEALANL